jgi:hypothetical protein
MSCLSDRACVYVVLVVINSQIRRLSRRRSQRGLGLGALVLFSVELPRSPYPRTSENFPSKPSEKPRTHPRRSPVDRQGGAFAPFWPPYTSQIHGWSRPHSREPRRCVRDDDSFRGAGRSVPGAGRRALGSGEICGPPSGGASDRAAVTGAVRRELPRCKCTRCREQDTNA